MADHKEDTGGQSKAPILKFRDCGEIDVAPEVLEVEDEAGDTPLILAVIRGNKESVDSLLAQGANIQHKNLSGETALHYAAMKGSNEIVTRLINCGADINSRTLDQQTPLMSSCLFNCVDTVKVLLEAGAGVEEEDFCGHTALSNAVGGHTGVVDALLRSGANLHHVDKQGRTPLYAASTVEMVQKLIECGADVNHKNKRGWTVLICFSSYGYKHIIDYLLSDKVRADVNIVCNDGWTALMSASQNGHTDSVKSLLSHGADPNIVDCDGNTALMSASQNGHTDSVKSLLSHGADPNIVDCDGNTALMSASQNGHTDSVKSLLSHGADPNIVDCDGNTALMLASQNGHTDIVKSLLSHGADPNIVDCDGNTALMLASQNGHTDSIKSLLSHGADPNIVHYNGNTALRLASDSGHTNIVKLLEVSLRADASPVDKHRETARDKAKSNSNTKSTHLFPEPMSRSNAEVQERRLTKERQLIKATETDDNDQLKTLLETSLANTREGEKGRPLLLTCVSHGNIEGVKLLIGADACVNMSDEDGTTPLMEATKRNNSDIVKTLLDAGADVNLKDKEGKTALMFAAERGGVESVERLLSKSPDINTQDMDGMTALMFAAQSDHSTIVRMLLDSSALVTLCSDVGKTALQLSVEKRHVTSAKELLTAELESKYNVDRKTTLHCLVRRGDEVKTRDLLNSLIDLKTDYVNVPDKSGGMTALMYGSVRGQVDLIRLLIKHKADVSRRRKDMKTCLHLAVLAGHDDIVRVLLDEKLFKSGLKVDLCDDENRDALMMAAHKGNVDLVSFFLSKKMKVNRQDTRGWSPLMFCGQHGFTDIMEKLIVDETNLELKCDSGDTVLGICAANGHEKAVTMLIGKGANVNTTNALDLTPLMLAAGNNHQETVLSLLKGHDINLEVQSDLGDTVLHICAAKGLKIAIKQLLEKGAILNCRNEDWNTPLMLAVQNNDLETVELLLTKNPNLHYADKKYGNTALHCAAERGFENIALMLLRKKVEINERNMMRRTALHLSSSKGHRTIVNKIVHFGGSLDLDLQDRDGNTALMLSVSNNKEDVTNILIGASAQTGIKNKRDKTALDLGAEFGSTECVELLLETGQYSQIEKDQAEETANSLNHTGLVDVIKKYCRGKRQITRDTGDAQGISEERDNDMDLSGQTLQVRVEPCSQQFFENHQRDSYCMSRNPRGLALIINVFRVRGVERPRYGTDVDRDNLIQLLTQLHFEVIVYNDEDGLAADVMNSKIREFSRDRRHSTGDACIVCLLSHGKEECIYGTDGELVKLPEIYDMFNNKNCPQLIDKPKLFIIQACRGTETCPGVACDVPDATNKVPGTADMLKCFPTQPFYVAFRDEINGSWFIEAIVKTFMKYAKSEDVGTMLNRVNEVVSSRVTRNVRSQKQNGLMQMSEYHSSLRRPHLYFFPGIIN